MYERFYKLAERPFAEEADMKFFYRARSQKPAILHLRKGFLKPHMVTVLSGEKGIGKTALMAYMLRQMDSENNVVVFLSEPPKKDRDFLPAILRALGVPFAENRLKILFNELYRYVNEQAKRNRKVRLVIDNADRLSKYNLEMVRLLSRSRINEQGVLQITLLGSDDLENALVEEENESLRKVAISYRMRPLKDVELREYVEHRLSSAGWSGAPVIEDEVYAVIHEQAGGVPRDINRYCDRILMLGMLLETQRLNKNTVAKLNSGMMAYLDKLEVDEGRIPEGGETPNAVVGQPEVVESAPKETAQDVRFEMDLKFEDEYGSAAGNVKEWLNKKTLSSVTAVCLVAAIATVVFNKNSASHAGQQTQAVSLLHPETNEHSPEAVAGPSERGEAPEEYVLEEITAGEGGDTSHGSPRDSKLLDIQQLIKESRRAGSPLVSDEKAGKGTAGLGGGSPGSASHKTPEATAEVESHNRSET